MESKMNPWEVSSVEDFLFYNCPECELKTKDSSVLVSHALEFHELARYTFSSNDHQHHHEPMLTNNEDVFEDVKPDLDLGELGDLKPEVKLVEEDEDIPLKPKSEKIKSFKCDMCDFTCDKANKLVSHKHEEHYSEPGEKKYKCDKCDYQGAALKHLKRHKNQQHSDVLIQCDACSQTFKNKNALYMHKIRRHTADNPYKCDLCDYSAKTNNDLKKHKLCAHEKVRAKVCHICGKGFVLTSVLNLHITNVHFKDGKSVVCDKCGKSFNTPKALKEHMHNVHKSFLLCTLCERVFPSKKKLNKHIKDEHDIECNNEQMFICPTCQSCHASSQDLNEHLKSQHNLTGNEHPCDKCDKSFPLRMMLTVHFVECHDFNPMKNSEVLNVSKVIEDPQINQFNCDKCDKKFLNYRTLTGHKKQFHEENNIKCDLCDYRTYANYKLREHIEAKHMEQTKYQVTV